MTYDNVNNVVGELFKSFLPKYQNGLEAPVRGSDFTIDSVQLLSYKCHNKHFKWGGSHIESPDRIKSKKGSINLKNKDGKCFLIFGNGCIKLWRNQITPRKSFTYQTIYK